MESQQQERPDSAASTAGRLRLRLRSHQPSALMADSGSATVAIPARSTQATAPTMSQIVGLSSSLGTTRRPDDVTPAPPLKVSRPEAPPVATDGATAADEASQGAPDPDSGPIATPQLAAAPQSGGFRLRLRTSTARPVATLLGLTASADESLFCRTAPPTTPARTASIEATEKDASRSATTSKSAVDSRKVWRAVSKAVVATAAVPPEQALRGRAAALFKLRVKMAAARVEAVLPEFHDRVRALWMQRRLAYLTGSAPVDGALTAHLGSGRHPPGGVPDFSDAAGDAEYLRLLEKEVRHGSESAQTTLALFKTLTEEVRRAQRQMALLSAAADYAGEHTNDAVMTDDALQQRLLASGFSGSLLPFQVEGLRWLYQKYCVGHGAILADEMGLGKTVQVIALLHFIRGSPAASARRGGHGPHLILVPLSTIGNWEAEFDRFGGAVESGADSLPRLRVLVLRGDGATCRTLLQSFLPPRSAVAKKGRRGPSGGSEPDKVPEYGYDVVLVPHHRFAKSNDTVVRLLLPVQWSYIVVDEAQRIKNANAQMTQLLMRCTSERRLALTGTPLQNDLMELWSLMAFLLPTVFSKRADQLKRLFEQFTMRQKEKKGSFDDSDEREVVLCTKLHQVFSPIVLRREKKEVASQLPSLTETMIYCPVTAGQQAALAEALRTTTHVHRTAAKVLLHPYAIQNEFDLDQRLLTMSGKFAVLDILLRFLRRCSELPGIEETPRAPHKVLIFSSWIVTLDMVQYYCGWRGFDFVRLDGGVALEDRQLAMRRFAEDPNCCIFLISKGAGGVGLNLQAADTVVLLDVHYNPQSDLQALARAWRVGQQRQVKVFRLVTDTPFERRVIDISQSKVAVEQKVIGAGRYNLHSTNEEREAVLRTVLGDWSTTSGGDAEPNKPHSSRVADVEEHLEQSLLSGLCRGDEEVALMKSMLQGEGLLHDLLASVAAPTADGGTVGGQTTRHVRQELHGLHDTDGVLGSDDDASSTSSGVLILEADSASPLSSLGTSQHGNEAADSSDSEESGRSADAYFIEREV